MTARNKKRIFFIVFGIILLAFSIYAFRIQYLPDAIVGSFFGLAVGFIIIGIRPRKEKVNAEN